jgi:hypothetical protein
MEIIYGIAGILLVFGAAGLGLVIGKIDWPKDNNEIGREPIYDKKIRELC